MKKVDIKTIVIILLSIFLIFTLLKKPKEIEKIVEVEKEVIVTDTIEVEVPYEVEVITEVPYQLIKEIEKLVMVHDTIQIEKRIEVPIEVIKEIDRIVEVERPKTTDWYLGLGYDFGTNPFFSGAGTRLLYKTKNDIMFGGEVGFRNNITDFETMQGKITPYIGGTIYIKLNK